VTTSQHQYALLAPWYQRARDDINALAEAARQPAIQKYIKPDFTDRLLADPRDSIAFDPDEDSWSYSVPIGAVPGKVPTKRQSLSGRIQVHSGLRKLYQPSHERFYVVVVELVCDEPGFPLASRSDGLTVGFVVRRIVTAFGGQDKDLRSLARKVTDNLAEAETKPSFPDADDFLEVSSLVQLETGIDDDRDEFLATNADLIASAAITTTRQKWAHDEEGTFAWVPEPAQAPGAAPAPAHMRFGDPEPYTELSLPMWRLPASDTCDSARHRSLWFGVVPTYSSDRDDSGAPRFDDQSAYFIQCFVRKDPPRGHEHCPPQVWWSDETQPYRLAAFFDPDGTKNRSVRVKLPDLRSLAARAGGPGGGGVEFERPPRSALQFSPAGKTPTAGTTDNASTEICTFAIELLTIVAMFLFSLFLPIVVFVFQLWWLLLLRFCWPPKFEAIAALEAFFATNPPVVPVVDVPTQRAIGDLFGVTSDDGQAVVDRTGSAAAAGAVLHDIVGATLSAPPEPAVPQPESKPDDPLCTRTGSP
jgi:hypothetical protein